ncbi:MAG: glucosamine--fructose-6-phosphate aminotransferase [Chloroflexi bacterium HGW-Chloroflexi-6]|nr:MAG: glucosamine--fructose-6-phosphate aminotransferase [Chloroflexi bacterium HGW-Chloroflexi-6]
MSLYSEIHEQPHCLHDLLLSQRKTVENIAEAIRGREIDYVFLAARGTSDNAGRYANYLWGALNQLPIALAAPSLFTYYEAPPRLKNALVLGISQSGQSPDIVSVLEEGRRQNCLTLAITNAPDSPLSRAADFTLDIESGPERAVAATKTYTAQLMAIAMLSVALSGDEKQWDALAQVPAWIEQTLKQDSAIEQASQRYRYMRQCVVLGRGYNYSTAFEWALKLKELTYVEAEPYSSADFQHGPIAMIENSFPVMAVAPHGKVFDSMSEALIRLRNDFGAELVVISNDPAALTLAQTPLPIPVDVPEWLTPLVSIVPAQLFAYHLTRAKGFNTESPRSIRKVTETH